jgi:hypothetical protein
MAGISFDNVLVSLTSVVSTSSTGVGFDKLNQRWFRQAQPALVSTSSTSFGCGRLNQDWLRQA